MQGGSSLVLICRDDRTRSRTRASRPFKAAWRRSTTLGVGQRAIRRTTRLGLLAGAARSSGRGTTRRSRGALAALGRGCLGERATAAGTPGSGRCVSGTRLLRSFGSNRQPDDRDDQHQQNAKHHASSHSASPRWGMAPKGRMVELDLRELLKAPLGSQASPIGHSSDPECTVLFEPTNRTFGRSQTERIGNPSHVFVRRIGDASYEGARSAGGRRSRRLASIPKTWAAPWTKAG